jgi:allophanate hydrolase
VTETIAEIVAAHRAGTVSPAQTIARCFERIRDHNDPAIFISLRDEKEAVAEAEALATKKDAAQLPLYGVPVAVKDNIDVAGLPTTAGCPAYAYSPSHDATAVARLRAAGAIIIGKTNLDQFATGLVGVRSPYGIPTNPVRGDLIPGGSSSGSAVAVSAGLVPLALGTDTAGSGRVPAMLNNIVGLKPSLGLISTAGVVPACRTLDCVSILSLTADDAMTALTVMAGLDAADSFSRNRPLAAMSAFPGQLKLGVPPAGQLIFFGDKASEAAYRDALQRWTSLGATLVEFDLEPFYETARLLYEGPWVAERYLVIRDLLASAPEAIHPVTREITIAGARLSAADTFAALYRLQALHKSSERAFAGIDALVLPTAPTAYSTAQVLANPIELNSRLGTYTNFVNLLDLCGLAIPAAIRPDGIPFGITLLAPAGRDAQLASIGRVFHADTELTLGRAAAAACGLASEDERRRNRPRGGRRASLGHGAQRRTEGARRTIARGDHDRGGLQALCTRHHAAEARHAAGRDRGGIVDRAGALGTVGGELRKIRRRDSATAVDRHRAPGRWPRREGLYCRARRNRRRARYLGLQWLAGVCDKGGGGLGKSLPLPALGVER